MKILIGMVVGSLAVWLYSSERSRTEMRQRFSRAPESVQRLQQTLATAAAGGAQRVSEVIESAPVPDPVKDTASGAAFNVWAAADKLGQAATEPEVTQGGEAPTKA